MKRAMKSVLPDRSKRFKDNKGFSLPELLVAATLMSIIVLLTAMTYLNSANAADTTINISNATAEARLAMYYITKDLREINGIIEADDSQVRFYCNVDQDEDMEEVHYYTVENEGYYSLRRDYEDISRTIGTRLTSDQIFEYFTAFGEDSLVTPVDNAQLANIKSIDVRLIVERQQAAPGSNTMDLETSITLRNRI